MSDKVRPVLRRAIVAVSPELLLRMKVGFTFQVDATDVPDGATFVGADYSPEAGCMLVCIEHPSLPPTPIGERLPVLNGPTFSER